MSCLFYGCSSLSSLPDISKWNTNSVTDMSSIFYGCTSLSILSDISKWNTNNGTGKACMFYLCPNVILYKATQNKYHLTTQIYFF